MGVWNPGPGPTAGGDIYSGDGLVDNVNGLGGNDWLLGGGGDDTLNGDADQDVLEGGANNDTLIGGSGDDDLYSGSGQDALFGGSGFDDLSFGEFFGAGDFADGGADGGRLLLAGNYNVTLSSANISNLWAVLCAPGFSYVFTIGSGVTPVGASSFHFFANDLASDRSITVDASATSTRITVNGGAGNDTMIGGSGRDFFNLSHGGSDTASGNGGNDTFFFDAGFNTGDRLNGGNGDDLILLDGDFGQLILSGTVFANMEGLEIWGLHDYDIVTTDDFLAADTTFLAYGDFLGGDAQFSFDGSAETDARFELYGGWNGDLLIGGSQLDLINGGEGDDILEGGGGPDVLTHSWVPGDDDTDVLIGGEGSDAFIVGINDTINDAEVGEIIILEESLDADRLIVLRDGNGNLRLVSLIEEGGVFVELGATIMLVQDPDMGLLIERDEIGGTSITVVPADGATLAEHMSDRFAELGIPIFMAKLDRYTLVLDEYFDNHMPLVNAVLDCMIKDFDTTFEELPVLARFIPLAVQVGLAPTGLIRSAYIGTYINMVQFAANAGNYDTPEEFNAAYRQVFNPITSLFPDTFDIVALGVDLRLELAASIIDQVEGFFDRFLARMENVANKITAIGATPVAGTDQVDLLVGDGLGNTFIASRGGDVYAGGDGEDLVSYNGFNIGILADLEGKEVAYIDVLPGEKGDTTEPAGGEIVDDLGSIEHLIGTGLADTIRGNSVSNNLQGGAGNDIIEGRGGNDVLDGGAGIDTAVFAIASSNASWSRNPNGAWTVSSPALGADTVSNIEVLDFTDRDIFLDRPGSNFSTDGVSDLFLRNTSTGAMVMWFNGNAATSAYLGTLATKWANEGFGDFNGDGRDDLLWRDSTNGNVSMWFMNNNNVVGTAGLGVGAAWSITGIGDLNGDNCDDIVLRSTNGDLVTWFMNGATINGAYMGNVSTAWQIEILGDFNVDGRDDFIWRNGSTGDMSMWLMNGTAVTPNNFANVGGAWNIAGVGDLNGDGRDDVVWRNQTTGDTALWFMNGGQIVSQSGFNVSSVYSIADIGDFNGDGRDDIMWRSNTTNDVFAWFMNGGAVQGSAYIGNLGADWIINPGG